MKCIDDEIPFEVPHGWEWCYFSQIIQIASNLVDSSNYGTYKHIAPDNIEKGTGRLLSCNTVAEDKVISNNHLFYKGQIIYSKIRPLLRKCVIAPFDGLCSADMYPLNTSMDYTYILYILLSDMFNRQVAEICASRVKMPKINQEELSQIFIPLPPLAEQRRIVTKVQELSPIVEQYGKAQFKLDILNKGIKPLLRKSILQEAIQGKLVTQDPNDEPASALLQHIKEEKQRLVKEGKLKKKDVVDSVIFKGDDNRYFEKIGKEVTCIDEDIPFDIPKGWEWTRLSVVSDIYTGNSISETEKRTKYTEVTGRYYIGTKDVGFDNNIKYNNGVAIPKEYESKFRIAPDNSVLMCIEGGSAGRKIAVLNQDVCFGNKLCCFVPFVNMTRYIYYYLQSPLFLDMFNDNKTGIIGGVSIAKVKNILIPLPPYQEIERIVNKIDNVVAGIMRR